MVKGAKKRVLEFDITKDGTYDALTKKSVTYNNGFQVSFVRPEAFEKLDDESWDLLTMHIMEQTGSIEHIGVYANEAETSFRTIGQQQAEYYMQLFHQENILNWCRKKIFPDPDLWDKWFIYNKSPDRNEEVDYDRIMQEIRANY